MARGLPAVWSSIIALPLLGGGIALHTGERYVQSFGLPLAGLGVFILLVGIYVHLVAPDAPTIADNEQILAKKHPKQRAAALKAALSVPFLVAAAYLLYLTEWPYVYPTVAFLLGLGLLSSGLWTYWRNSLTTYYLTNRRIISVYRFFGLARTEIQLHKVRAIKERRSVAETLARLGNVHVAAGGDQALMISVNNIRDSNAFAEALRDAVSSAAND
jgi:hypothetical protein